MHNKLTVDSALFEGLSILNFEKQIIICHLFVLSSVAGCPGHTYSYRITWSYTTVGVDQIIQRGNYIIVNGCLICVTMRSTTEEKNKLVLRRFDTNNPQSQINIIF